MAINRYVTVNITQDKPEIVDYSLGRILILGTSKAVPFTVLDAEEALEKLKEVGSFGAESKEYKIAEAILNQDNKPSEIAVLGVVYTEEETVLTNALDAAVTAGNSFYYLCSPEQTAEPIKALADWANKNERAYFVSVKPEIASSVSRSFPRTYFMVHEKADEQYPAEALLGECAARITGTYTWKFKQLNGVDPSTLGEAAITAIHRNNCASFIRVNGYNVSSNDTFQDGEYVDVVQTMDYLERAISNAVFGVFVTMDKVPYVQSGLDLIEAAIVGALNNSPDGMLATDENGAKLFTVKVPALSGISSLDKLKRVLKDVKFNFTIAGAIGEVEVNGVLEY